MLTISFASATKKNEGENVLLEMVKEDTKRRKELIGGKRLEMAKKDKRRNKTLRKKKVIERYSKWRKM